jgi:hypothetical protein
VYNGRVTVLVTLTDMRRLRLDDRVDSPQAVHLKN